MRFSTAMRAFVAASALALVPAAAQGAAAHTDTVSENAADWVPELVSTTAVPKPRVDAITADVSSATAYAGGRFDRVTDGGTPVPRSNLFGFSRTTGQIVGGFAPSLDGVVRAVENAADGGVYVGGDFRNVNQTFLGRGLVKLDASGRIDTAFKPPIKGNVYDLELFNGHLIVAGNAGKRLTSLNPTNGANDNYINLTIAGEARNTSGSVDSWGTTSVYDVAVTSGKLAAVGNFATVNGQPRSKFFMLNLGGTGSSLSGWYYNSFATPCATDHPRRIANLQGVDFSPSGDFVSVAATGQIPEQTSEIWHAGDGAQSDSTVCDGFGRFNANVDTDAAQWINYTGGDSVWRVQDTGHAVYATGHFRWVDNPDGFASACPAGDTCARRSGIAAVDATRGTALAWNPATPTTQGGKGLVATSQGLWVGSDSAKFGSEDHRGLAFAPR